MILFGQKKYESGVDTAPKNVPFLKSFFFRKKVCMVGEKSDNFSSISPQKIICQRN
jgi:hypothetical protein